MAGKRASKGEGRAGAPAWMATFADMATLLLCFFVMLLSFSTIQEAKFHDAIRSLKGAFGVLQNPPTVIAQSETIQPRAHEQEIEEIIQAVEDISRVLNEQGLSEVVTLSVEKGGMTIRISSPFLFHSARAELRTESFDILDRIAVSLLAVNQNVRIEGHTDNLPISTAEFPSNWELAGGRALSVLRYLRGKDIPPGRLCAVSFGEHRPVDTNDTDEGRGLNRRVEIFVELKDLESQAVIRSLVPGERS